MFSTKDRLELSAKVLTALDQRRIETGNLSLGAATERLILNREIREIEQEILANPGPLKTLLPRDK